MADSQGIKCGNWSYKFNHFYISDLLFTHYTDLNLFSQWTTKDVELVGYLDLNERS